MKYKVSYPDQASFEAAVSEPHRDLFEQRGDAFVFIGVEGIKTSEDVTKLTTALSKEREDHKATKASLKSVLGDRTLDETVALIDSVADLTAQVETAKKPDDERVNALADSRARAKILPLERENATLKTQLSEANGRIAKYEASDRARAVQTTMLSVARGGAENKGPKVLPHAEEDMLNAAERVMVVNEDGSVTTKDGTDPMTWLYEVAPKKPHWFEPSEGGGGKGSRTTGTAFTKNPWTKKDWNFTEQAKEIKADSKRAEQMAKAAGSYIGATKPPEK